MRLKHATRHDMPDSRKLRYNTGRINYISVRSKTDANQTNLPHGTKNKKQ